MTPKAQADKLYAVLYKVADPYPGILKKKDAHIRAKKASLYFCEQMTRTLSKIYKDLPEWKHWNEVKEEIEKL